MASLKENMRQARRVERHKIMDEKEAVDVYKDGISIGERLKKLLRPLWFVKDLDQPRRKK